MRVCVWCELFDQLMMIPGSSAVGEEGRGGGGRNWLSVYLCVCVVRSADDGSSAVGEGGRRGGRNWLSPQGDRGFKVEIETGVVGMRSNLKLYK